jgi:hypothetical protein
MKRETTLHVELLIIQQIVHKEKFDEITAL